jgi:flavin reductase (DIM6/NTAB) family NADH-FMN oxidoreductase RutF
MNDTAAHPFAQVLAELPSGLFVFSGQYEGKRAGVLVRTVMQCATEPPLVCVCLEKGHWVSPIVRDSHHFGLSALAASDRLSIRKFSDSLRGRDGDPFDCMPVERLTSSSPLLTRSRIVMDCEVVRHFDLEADTELFVGRIIAARLDPVQAPQRTPEADASPQAGN